MLHIHIVKSGTLCLTGIQEFNKTYTYGLCIYIRHYGSWAPVYITVITVETRAGTWRCQTWRCAARVCWDICLWPGCLLWGQTPSPTACTLHVCTPVRPGVCWKPSRCLQGVCFHCELASCQHVSNVLNWCEGSFYIHVWIITYVFVCKPPGQVYRWLNADFNDVIHVDFSVFFKVFPVQTLLIVQS